MSATKEIPHAIPVIHKAMEVVRAIALSEECYNLTTKVLATETGIFLEPGHIFLVVNTSKVRTAYYE